ncbi:MAG: gliding motility-associated C-terminal domain-containing protein, partial [Cyclobacteriaceae bacterium]
AVNNPRGIATADLNLDGKPEIIVTSAPNSLLVFENLIPSVSINFTTQPANVIICEGNNSTLTVVATGDTNLQYQWQVDNAGFVNLTNSATYSGVNTSTLVITNPALTLSGAIFRCLVRGDNSLFTPSNTASLTINEVPVMDLSTTTRCSDEPLDHFLVTAGSVTAASFTISSKTVPAGLSESGNALVPASGVAFDYLVNEKYTNKGTSVLFVNYVVIPFSSDNCSGPPATISFAINPQPTLASTLDKQICSNSPVGIILVAAPGSISTDNFALLSVTVETGLLPAASNAGPSGDEGANFLANDSFTNNTTGPLKVTYLVTGVNVNGCSSDPVLIVVTVFPLPCTNQPPAIVSTVTAVPIEGVVVIDLITLISDADNNLDLSTLRVVSSTSQQGAVASIDASNQLVLDYGSVLFAGIDRVTIEVCDLFGECTQQLLEIDVIGDIEVYNGISPNGDEQNDIFLIRYIDLLPETEKNKVTIFNRWGSKVFEVDDYNNTTNVFRGLNNNGNELPSGTYFYKIEFNGGRKSETGYLSLKR